MSDPILPKHRFFSPGRILTVASYTLTELIRLKVFYILLLFAICLMGSSFFVSEFAIQDQFQAMKDVSLGAMDKFIWLLGLLSTAMLIPKDLEDRTLYTILAKPVHRHEYLIGKLMGVLMMLLMATLAMAAFFLIILYLREQVSIAQISKDFVAGGEVTLQDEIARVKSATFNWNLLPAMAIIYVKCSLLAALTLLISTISTSWIFTVIVSMCAYLIGSLVSTAREAWEVNRNWLGHVFLGTIALIFPDLQLFNLSDDVVAGAAIPALLFWKTFGLGCVYGVVYLALSQFAFLTREL